MKEKPSKEEGIHEIKSVDPEKVSYLRKIFNDYHFFPTSALLVAICQYIEYLLKKKEQK